MDKSHMRIGARTVLSTIVLGCVLLSAGTVHFCGAVRPTPTAARWLRPSAARSLPQSGPN